MRRVVITGMGALTPIGNNVTEFWKNAIDGKSGSGPISTFDTTNFKTKFACELKNYNPLDHFDRKEVKTYDLFTQYALVAVNEAVNDASIEFSKLDLDRIGVIWGSGNGGIQTFEEQMKEYFQGDGTPRFSPFFIPRILVDIAAGIISMKYGLRGVNYCPVSACATSTTAIIDAFNYIRWNKADVILTGGSEAAICPATVGGFGAAKALSTDNDNFATASKPFDTERNGFVMGEGSGALLLEEYEHAIRRGAKIYGEIVGGGMAGDAYHLTGTHPEGRGAVRGMSLAIEEAGITPDDVDYVNMHATSTPLGDKSELIAVEKLFGRRRSLTLGGTKSMTGHLLGAAGAIEAILSVKALQEQIVPPTINTKNIEPEFKDMFDFPLDKSVKRKLNFALSNTFGFGGHIAAVLFKRYEQV
ncbi:MAG: beta-ketoacyl-ACP synthase II [Brumimicrobium sp.]|nr:beta-ketoacyl-ACP synthase II [Brumimicrobium sp.]